MFYLLKGMLLQRKSIGFTNHWKSKHYEDNQRQFGWWNIITIIRARQAVFNVDLQCKKNDNAASAVRDWCFSYRDFEEILSSFFRL